MSLVGDRGQRYEVTCLMEGERRIVGWSDEKSGADRLVSGVNLHPSWTDPMILDRHALLIPPCQHEWVACGEAFMTGDPIHPVICAHCGVMGKTNRSKLKNPPDHQRWMALVKEFGHE